MPVEDRPVHPSVIQDPNGRYGCHNRRGVSAGYWAQDGHVLAQHGEHKVALPRVVWVPHVMSVECKFDLSATDPRCRDCVQCE